MPLVDEFGNQVERTPYTHPYSYDGFVTYRNGDNNETNGTVYTDRLLDWDYRRTRELQTKHFGNQGDYWDRFKPEAIQVFLCDYMEKPVKLVLIMQYCNQSSGYPVWRLDYKS